MHCRPDSYVLSMWFFSDSTPNPLLYSRVPVVPRLSWPWWFGFVDFNITFDQQVFDTMSWIMHVFWWVLTYNLFEDNRTDDVNKKICLIWFCTINDHRRCQNVVRTSVTHSAAPQYHFMLLPHCDVVCNLLLNRRLATKNLFVKYFQTKTKTMTVISRKSLILSKWLISLFP